MPSFFLISEMFFFIRQFLFLTTLSLSIQFKLEDDNNSNGIIFIPQGKLNVLEKYKSITYALDVSILDEMGKIASIIEQNCPNEIRNLKTFTKKYEAIKMMKNFNSTIKFSPQHIYTNPFIHTSFLEENINIFRLSNKTEYCRGFRRIVYILSNAYDELDRLRRRDFTTLGEIVSYNQLKNDVTEITNTTENRNLTFLFDYSEYFVSDFLINSEFLMHFGEKTIYLTFIFSMFKPLDAYSVYPKPFHQNNTSYFLKTTSQYVASNNSNFLFYNDSSLDELCSHYNRSKFCLKPNNSNVCDKKYITFANISNLDRQCFDELPAENMAVQVYNRIYFSLIYPTTIHLYCDNDSFSVLLSKNSKLDLENCTIKTSFFKYNNISGRIHYKIYKSTYTSEEYETWISKFDDGYIPTYEKKISILNQDCLFIL